MKKVNYAKQYGIYMSVYEGNKGYLSTMLYNAIGDLNMTVDEWISYFLLDVLLDHYQLTEDEIVDLMVVVNADDDIELIHFHPYAVQLYIEYEESKNDY